MKNKFKRQLERWERLIVAALCVAAVVRILILAAAFPLFNQIDEPLHFDLVVTYAQGHMPWGLKPFSDEAVRLIAIFQSSEYVRLPRAEAPPPLWTMPPQPAEVFFKSRLDLWRAHGNFEATQPPLYYAAAAIWYRLGFLAGLREMSLIYWIRFLNALVMGLLVWLSHRWISRIYPDRTFERIGVPLLVAFFPQQSAYSINNDAFSPVFFGAAFFGLAEVLAGRVKNAALVGWIGFFTAATLLVKNSNIAIAAIFAVVLASRIESALKKSDRQSWRDVLILTASTTLPLLLWCAWNVHTVGEPTGGAFKAKTLGWSMRPLNQYCSHPLWTPRAAVGFLRDIMVSLWRGEFWWHGVPLKNPWLDVFYSLSSWGFMLLAAASLRKKPQDDRSPEDVVASLGLFAGLVSLAFLTVLSLIYIYPVGGYPTREAPFLYSGRLVWGMLVPFLMLYLRGFGLACKTLRLPRAATLVIIIVTITAAEAALPTGLFASRYNWFHRPAPAVTESFR